MLSLPKLFKPFNGRSIRLATCKITSVAMGMSFNRRLRGTHGEHLASYNQTIQEVTKDVISGWWINSRYSPVGAALR